MHQIEPRPVSEQAEHIVLDDDSWNELLHLNPLDRWTISPIASQAYVELELWKLRSQKPWRLDITSEMGAAQVPRELETERILLGHMA
jgi:hypothetical protein